MNNENYKHIEHANINGEVNLCIYETSYEKGLHKMRIATRGEIKEGDTIGKKDTIYRLMEIIDQNKSSGDWSDGVETIGIFQTDVLVKNDLRFNNKVSKIILHTRDKIDIGFKMPAIGRKGMYELTKINNQNVSSVCVTEGIVEHLL